MEHTDIQETIYELRGMRVMLDRDLAKIYQVPVKSLNLAVRRNLYRFPPDFMFQLNKDEWLSLRFQSETSKRGGDRYLPYAFTELGVAMLSSVLNSQRAIQMNMLIMRTFVFIRQNIMTYTELAKELMDIRQRVENHDEQLHLIYEAIEKILDTKTKQKKWEDRAPIGFRK